MKRSLALTGALLLCSLTFYLVSCRRDNSGTTSTAPANPVTISNYSFSSANLQIKAGATVTWTNMDNTTHTVTADDNTFTSGDLNHGDTYSHTFTSAAVIHYHCKYHTMMIAIVTAQ